MRFRNLVEIIGIHPVLPILMSIAFLVFAIFSAVLFSDINESGHGLDLTDFATGPELRSEKIFLQLTMGRPWLALGVGVAIGLVIVWIEKRALRKELEDPRYIDKLAESFLLTNAQRRKQWWQSWTRRRLHWPAMLCLFLAVILPCVFRWSIKVCVYGVVIPWAMLYPEYRRLYEGVFARLMNAGAAGPQPRAYWEAVRKRADVAVAITALVILGISIPLVYTTVKIASALSILAK